MQEYIHGAKWWKFDFHNHTPASNDFGKGDATHIAITPENWLLMYMTAGIDCVAITDHNSGEWIDKLKIALAAIEAVEPKPAGYRKLYFFLTLKYQPLVILTSLHYSTFQLIQKRSKLF